MSDFDREAEREKLREKYERDEQKRKHSERMSELLLKGATMTNVHCEECGDPIFRYDGQEFCPTCQREVGTGAGAEAGPGAGAGDVPDTADPDTAEPAEPTSGEERPDAGDAGTDADQSRPDPDREPASPDDAASGDGLAGTGRDAEPVATPEAPTDADQSAAGSGPVPEEDATPGSAVDAPGAGPEREQDRTKPGPSAPADPRSEPAAGDGSLAEARRALVRTLADSARQAEATTDPRTRRDHLAAAREAAEALSALR